MHPPHTAGLVCPVLGETQALRGAGGEGTHRRSQGLATPGARPVCLHRPLDRLRDPGPTPDSPQEPPPGLPGERTAAAAAAALHVPLVDGRGDIPVAQAAPLQGVLVAAVEADVAPRRHLLCGQKGAHKPLHTRGRKRPSARDHLLLGALGRGAPRQHCPLAAATWTSCAIDRLQGVPDKCVPNSGRTATSPSSHTDALPRGEDRKLCLQTAGPKENCATKRSCSWKHTPLAK